MEEWFDEDPADRNRTWPANPDRTNKPRQFFYYIRYTDPAFLREVLRTPYIARKFRNEATPPLSRAYRNRLKNNRNYVITKGFDYRSAIDFDTGYIDDLDVFEEVPDIEPWADVQSVVPFPEIDFVLWAMRRTTHEFDFPFGYVFNDTDETIARLDLPERFQTRQFQVMPTCKSELEQEARWIYWQLYCRPTISCQHLRHVEVEANKTTDPTYSCRQPAGGRKANRVIVKIHAVLQCIRSEKLDIPFIAHYRKELFAPDLNVHDLWLIYKWDERWCRLYYAKLSLEDILNKVRFGILEINRSNPSEAKALRKIRQVDYYRLSEVNSPEELRDMYQFFGLYYGMSMPDIAMKFQRIMQHQRTRLWHFSHRLPREPPRRYVIDENRIENDQAYINSSTEMFAIDERDDRRFAQRDATRNEMAVGGETRQEVADQDQDDSMEEDIYEDSEEEEEEEEEEDGGSAEEEITVGENFADSVDSVVYEDIDEELPFAYQDNPSDTRYNIIAGYETCRKSGLRKLAAMFGLTPEQFAENLTESCLKHKAASNPVKPLAAAEEFIDAMFISAEEALQGARYMVAREIAHDPIVRRVARAYFFANATIKIRTTKAGRAALLEEDQGYAFRFVTGKPASSFKNDEYLQVLHAEIDELIRVGADVPPSYVDHLVRLYRSDKLTAADRLWNKQRAQAVKYAFKGILFPTFEDDLKARLIREAQDHVLLSISNKLYEWLRVAPYDPPAFVKSTSGFDCRSGVRIVGVAFEVEPALCVGVLIDGRTNPVDRIMLRFVLRKPEKLSDTERRMADEERRQLKRFLLVHKPHCVVVGTCHRKAPKVREAIQSVVYDLAEKCRFPRIEVVLMDDNLAKAITSEVKNSLDEFLDESELAAIAVSLARRLQDPLCEFAQLCSRAGAITKLRMHRMQEQLDQDELDWAITTEFINRVNEVGVDINAALQDARTSRLLQFVSGLGPRKVRFFQPKPEPVSLKSRADVIAQLKLGPTVFRNCAPFLRILPDHRSGEIESERGDVDLIKFLDNSRVHPEMYNFLIDVAVGNVIEPRIPLPSQVLEDLPNLRCPKVNVDVLVEALQRQGGCRREFTLKDITEELLAPYAEKRLAYVEPDRATMFYLMMQESPQDFTIGSLYRGKVDSIKIDSKCPPVRRSLSRIPIKDEYDDNYICPSCLRGVFDGLDEFEVHLREESCRGRAIGVTTVSENGVYAFVPTRFLSDKNRISPDSCVVYGGNLRGRVMKIDFEKLRIEMSARKSDVDDAQGRWTRYDEYFDHDARKRDEALGKCSDESCEQDDEMDVDIQLSVKYPSFIYANDDTVSRLLKVKGQGDSVCWIPNEGEKQLKISWKIHGEICQTFNVRTADDNQEKMFVEGDVFRDIDDVLTRCVGRMAVLAREIIVHKNFREFEDPVAEAVELWLQQMKYTPGAPRGRRHVPFCFVALKQWPGQFLFAYHGPDRPVYEVITLTHRGLFYNQTMFSSLSKILDSFYRNQS